MLASIGRFYLPEAKDNLKGYFVACVIPLTSTSGVVFMTRVNYLVYSLDHILIVLPFVYYTLNIVDCKLDTR